MAQVLVELGVPKGASGVASLATGTNKRQKALLIKVMVLTQNPARRARRARSWEFAALAMQRSNRMIWRALAMAALVQALGACSSDLSLNNLTLVPKPERSEERRAGKG